MTEKNIDNMEDNIYKVIVIFKFFLSSKTKNIKEFYFE
jgi:hypothetical protein